MKMNRLPRLTLPALSTLLAATSVAHAHPGHHEPAGFLHGFMHPIGGLDHLLAMVAVGLWASQLAADNRRALWSVPLAFVSVMLIGGLLGASGIALPNVEAGIAASVAILGVLIAIAARLPLPASMAIVGMFALFHGHAHGAEMPHAASGLAYGAGFILATILLHAAGIGAALGTQKFIKSPQALPLRFAGAAVTLCGFALLIF